MNEAVIFDMDGVLVDTEKAWHEVRRDYVASFGRRWTEQNQRDCMGANSEQWSHYIRSTFEIPRTEADIQAAVVGMLKERYARELLIMPGACSAVRGLHGAGFRLAVASSSPLELLEFLVERLSLGDCLEALISSDEVKRGKPEPDVYLLACERLGVKPECVVAVEDSASGIIAAARAGLAVIAIPNQVFAPDEASLALAAIVLPSLEELTPELVGVTLWVRQESP